MCYAALLERNVGTPCVIGVFMSYTRSVGYLYPTVRSLHTLSGGAKATAKKRKDGRRARTSNKCEVSAVGWVSSTTAIADCGILL